MKIYNEFLRREFNTKKLKRVFVSYEYNGSSIWLTQDAHPDGQSDDKDTWVYKADAIDSKGNLYRVTWQVTDFETEDGENACDWEVYTVTEI